MSTRKHCFLQFKASLLKANGQFLQLLLYSMQNLIELYELIYIINTIRPETEVGRVGDVIGQMGELLPNVRRRGNGVDAVRRRMKLYTGGSTFSDPAPARHRPRDRRGDVGRAVQGLGPIVRRASEFIRPATRCAHAVGPQSRCGSRLREAN